MIIITTKRGRQGNEDVTVTFHDGCSWPAPRCASRSCRTSSLQDGTTITTAVIGNFLTGPGGNILDGQKYWRLETWNNGACVLQTFSYAKIAEKLTTRASKRTTRSPCRAVRLTADLWHPTATLLSNGILPGNDDYLSATPSFRGNTKIKGGLAWLNYGVTYVRKDVRNAMTGWGRSSDDQTETFLCIRLTRYGDLKTTTAPCNNADNYSPYAQNPGTLDHNY